MLNIKNFGLKVLLIATILLALLSFSTIAQENVVFSDDFNDNVLDTSKWTAYVVGGSSFQEANQEAQFSVSASGVYGYSLLCSTALNIENWQTITINGKWKFTNPDTAEVRCFLHDANTNAYVGVSYATWTNYKHEHIRFYYASGQFQETNREIPRNYVDFTILLTKNKLEYYENGAKIGEVATSVLANSNRFYLEIGGFDASGGVENMFFDDIEISVVYAEPPPEITVDSPENWTTYYTNEIWLNVSADREIAEWLYSLDSSANVSFTPNTTISVNYGYHWITFYAQDTSGNIGSKTVYFWVEDLPLISEVSANPSVQILGGYVNITANVYDYCSGVWLVKVNITDPEGQSSELIMNKVGDGGEGGEGEDGDYYGGLYYLNQSYSKAGIYQYYIIAIDYNENENVSEIFTFTITSGDIEPPEIIVTSPQPWSYYTTTTIWLNVSANEEVVSWLYSLDGSENVSFTPNTTIEVLNEGQHYIVVYASDSAGNIGFVWVDFFVDLSGPAISHISANPSTQVAGGYVEIICRVGDLSQIEDVRANITDPDSQSFSYQMNDIGDSIYALNQSYSKPGTYYFYIWAIDSLGHENSSAIYSFTIIGDTTPPQIYFLNPPADGIYYNHSTLNVTIQSNEELENATLWWNGNDYEMAGSGNLWYYEFIGLADGEYSYYITAYDLSGNYNATETRKITIDTLDPQYIEIILSTGLVHIGESIEVSVRWYDNTLDTAWLESNESGSWQKISEVSLEPSDDWSNFTIAFDKTGLFGLKVVATDRAGNSNSSPIISIEVVKEPAIISYSPEESPVYDSEGNSRTFTVVLDQLVDVVWYINEENVFSQQSVTSSSYTNSSAVAGEWRVTAVFENKNGSATIIWTWIVSEKDKEPPVIYKVTANPTIQEQGGYVEIACYVQDNIAVSSVFVNITEPDGILLTEKMLFSGEYYYYNSTYSKAGKYEFYIWAKDESGNENVSEIYSFEIVDLTPPKLYFISPTSDELIQNITWVNVSIGSDEALENATLYWQGNSYAMLGSGILWYYNVTGLTDGEYSYFVIAYDLFGNSNTTAIRTLKIDTKAPLISYQSPTPENNSILSSSTHSITISANSNEAVLRWILEWNGVNETIEGNGTSFEKTISVSSGKSYSFRLYAEDLAGNLGDAGLVNFRVRSSSSGGGGGAPLPTPTPTPAPLPEGNVVNLNTRHVFESIREAIDNESTLDGHTLLVREKDAPYEPIEVRKSLKIIGEEKSGEKPSIFSSDEFAVRILVNDVWIEGFEIIGEAEKANSGIIIENALNCVIANNTIHDFNTGIGILNSGNSKIVNNSILKAEYGISIEGHYVEPEKQRVISNNTIAGNSIEGCKNALIIVKSNENEISGNWISGNGIGINLEDSWWNRIYNNYLSNNLNAFAKNQEKNYWSVDKTAGKNIVGGIYVAGNYWSDYSNYEDRDGDGIGDTPYVIDDHNEDPLPLLKLPIMNNRTKEVYPSISLAVANASTGDEIIVKLKGKYYDNVEIQTPITIKPDSNLSLGDVVIVPSNASKAVFTIKSNGVKIEGFVITNAPIGVSIENAQNCTIAKNELKGNVVGIGLRNSQRNTISSNYILNNEFGISMQNSGQNTIYNNYISNINNTLLDNSVNNIWNIQPVAGRNIINGTNLGGNFWSDYIGRDSNKDGFGDTPYTISGSYTKDSYPLAKNLSRIYIFGNQNFTAENGVLYGSGTAEEPYLIEGYSLFLDNNTPVIQIENTTAHFLLRNCEVYSNAPAVLLKNVRNGVLEGIFSNPSMTYGLPSTGIMLVESINNEIRSCDLRVSRYSEAGIYLLNSSNNNLIANQIKTLVSRNMFDNTVYSGIKLNKSSNNSIERNDIENLLYGIHLISSSSNLIIENDASLNRKYGIFLDSSTGNRLVENNASRNSVQSDSTGIYLHSSSQNTIEMNLAGFNSLAGIKLVSSSNNVLRNNSAFNNSVGIIFESSNQNQLINNTAKSNADSGVFLLLSSNNTIRGNEFSCPEVAYPSAPSQNYGIKIQESDNNLFRDNIIINNAYGVYILFTLSQASSGNFSSNTFYNNFIKSQERYSMEFNTTSYQLEYRYYTINVGFAPTQQTYYDYSYYGEQAIRANKWNTTKTAGKNIVGGDYLGGNYWSDYKGADLNGDRLGDTLTPHYGDYMPLMLATTGIHITKNSEFTEENGVISGSGTANDPYVIANLEVNTISTHGIWIENTNAYFVVRNVTVYGGKQTLTTGILLQNVTNGRIEAINSIENNIGISVERSNNIRLDNCSFNSNNVAIAIEKSNNVSMHNFNLSNNNYGIQLGNSTNTTIHNSKFLNSSLYAINMTSSRLNSTQISLGTGVEIRNCVGFNITNSIIENVTQIGILWLNSSGVIYNNTIRWNREANIRIQNSSNVGILLNNLSYSKTGIEVKFSNNLTISGNKISNHYNLAEIGGGYGVKVESSENVTLIFNSILANSVFGISALNSNLSILNNKIVGVQNSMPPRWSVFASNVGIYSENSSGLVKNNYISGHTYAIYLNCPNTVRELSIVENTIAFSEEGIRDIACRNEFLERNRFFGNNYALKFNSPNLKKIRDNSFYTNNEMDVVVEIGGNAGNILLNRTYSEKGLNLTEGIISLNEVSWDSAERGGNALKSAIVGLNSTAFGFSKEVGGVLSVHVNASANANLSLFSGLYRERIYAVDTITGEIHELYAKNFTAQYGYLYPKSVDKDIVVNIYGLNNSIYDLFYEVIDTDGDKALGYARILVKNAKIVITNISSTTAERIYSLHRVPNPGQIFSSREDYNTTNERGSFVYVTVKNQGVKGGFGIIKIHVPDYVNGVAGEINKVIYLEPNETGNYTFYVLLTKYDPANGWNPSDPSVFPSNKKLPINVTVEDLPSYITADSKMHNISFKLGPVIRILDYDNYSYPRDPNNPSALYDGDGDGIIEAGEGYHFSLEFDNIGDEPANIQLFQHTETIICNSCKYIPPEHCRLYPDLITRTTVFEPGMSFKNPEDYYKPQFWDTPNRLFGDLYPNGTSGISYQYYREKLINDAHIDWWFDRPDLGYYPPIDYSGKEKITVGVYYSIPGQSLPHRYYTVSVNSYNLSVKALEKTFIPLSFHMADGDINAFVHSVSINNGIVNLRLKNDNDYVYYEYKFDGSYDPSPKGFKWYKVIPPEYTVEASAEKAKQPNTTIPHMKANVGIKWSLWANELKLGMMTLEAIVSILLDEATGGAIDIEFADAVMSFTNILLSLVNTYESGESTIPLTIEINKVQISTQELAEDGLDAEYFRRIANGDIDSSTATTFIKAVWNNDDLQKAFGREILKMVAKSLGLEKVYIVLVDPNSPEDAFDDFKDALLDYLKDSKRLTEDQAERIGKVVDAVIVFKDLGEWAYYNLEATRLDERSLNILDPPEDFVVEVSGEKRTYFGGLYKTQIDGEGNVSIRFLENGLVEIVGNYSTKPEKIPFNSEGIEELVVSLRGERDGEKMPGIAKVEIIPKAGYALEAFLAFRNPQLQRAFIAGYFEKLSNLTAITEGDRIVLIGEGTLAVSSDDVLIEGTIRLNKTIVEAQQRIVGYYTVEKEGKQKLSVNFNPTIGVPMNKTNLEVFVEDGAGFESDLPFKKEGNVYKLSYLPESLEANYLSAEKVQEGYKTYAIIALLAIVAFLALFIALRRR